MAFRPWSKVAPRVPVDRRTDAKGRVFDSQQEMLWYNELELLERAGRIRGLKRQVLYHLVMPLPEGPRPILIRSPGFPNGRVASYTLDAQYEQLVLEGPDRGKWRAVYAEWKGHLEPVSTLRRAVFESIYGVVVTLAGPAARKNARKRAKIEARRRAS